MSKRATSAALIVVIAVATMVLTVVVRANRHSTPETPLSTTAATRSAAATPPAVGGSTAAPTFPPGVSNPPQFTQLSSGGRTVTCEQQVGSFWADPAQGLPATPQELFRRSTIVAVVTASESHGYWQRDDGHLPAQNLTGLDYAPLTATNFSVERVVKGSVGPWLQLVDMGADPKNIAVCPKLAVVASGAPLPVVGQRYVIFLQRDPGRGLDRDTLGPLDFFLVANGTVHAPMRGVPDMPLDQFVARLSEGPPR